jgi:hypothetical protein
MRATFSLCNKVFRWRRGNGDRDLSRVIAENFCRQHPNFYLLISMPPLKNAPSPILIRCAVTSPVNEPSLRMSTRSLAYMLPLTLPKTTTSRDVRRHLCIPTNRNPAVR